jgi:hypothetical protein
MGTVKNIKENVHKKIDLWVEKNKGNQKAIQLLENFRMEADDMMEVMHKELQEIAYQYKDVLNSEALKLVKNLEKVNGKRW